MPFPTVRNFAAFGMTSSRSLYASSWIGLEAHAHRRGRTVVGVALKLVDQIFARVVRLRVAAVFLIDQPDMVMAIDQCGHHGLARQIHTSGVGRRLPLSFFPTHTKESPSTRNAELSTVGLLSPMIRRAPSNHSAGRRAWEEAGRGKHAEARIKK